MASVKGPHYSITSITAAGVFTSAVVPLLWLCSGRIGDYNTWCLHDFPWGGF